MRDLRLYCLADPGRGDVRVGVCHVSKVLQSNQPHDKAHPVLPVQSGLVALLLPCDNPTPGTKHNQSKETCGFSNLLPHMIMLA